MKTLFRHWTILLLALGFLPAAASAQFTFVTNANNTITITGYVGSNDVVTIPDTTNGYPVTSIEGSYMPGSYGNYGGAYGNIGFYSDVNLTNIIIPGSITNIGSGVFVNFRNLAAVTVNEENLFYSSVDGVLFDKQQTMLIEFPPGIAGSRYAIPDSVTNISSGAFYYCGNLTDVAIGTNVATIGSSAFTLCYGLTHMAIPDSVVSVGTNAFNDCWGLTNITIGANVATIEDNAFAYCSSLASVTIPNSVTNIGSEAFLGCQALINVNLGRNVASIGVGAFAACENLAAITMDEQNAFYSSMDGILFDKNQTMLVEAPGAFSGSYAIPDTVTAIGAEAFIYCTNLSGVTIPSSVINIGNNAFYYCFGLTNAVIGTNVVSIGDNTFAYCSSLTSIAIPDTVTNIGNSTFADCGSLTNAEIGMHVAGVGDNAFAYCSSLAGVTIPDSTANIGNMTFYSCGSLGSVALGANVTNVGTAAFASCSSLRSVIFPNSVLSIGSGTFDYCGSLTNVVISTNVTAIGSGAFNDCTNLTSLAIPNSVTNLGATGVTLSQAAILIEANRIYLLGSGRYDLPPAMGLLAANCPSLTAITVGGLNPRYSSANGILYDKNQSTLIEAPGGFAGSCLIPSSVTSIGIEAFRNCANLTGIAIPAGVTNIGLRAFAECSNLAAITVSEQNADYSSSNGVLFDKSQTTFIQAPGNIGGNYTISNGVTGIKSYAFYGCPNLTGLTIPESVTNVGYSAFGGCMNLTGIHFMGNAPTLAADMYPYPMPLQPPHGLGPNFYNPNTEAVYYLPGTTGWGTTFDGLPAYLWAPPFVCTPTNGAITINGCTNTAGAINIPDTTAGLPVTTIADGAFYQFGNLTNVVLGNNLTSIGSSAFAYCSNLTTITIPSGITNLGSFAFGCCDILNSVYFKGDAPAADSSVYFNFHIIIGPPGAYLNPPYPRIYFLPGTQGWGATFAGQPTVLWNPKAQASDANFGVRTNRFGFNITGSSNLVIVVEGCTNLASGNWIPIGTNTLNTFIGTNGASYFSDPQWTNYPARYYRLRSP